MRLEIALGIIAVVLGIPGFVLLFTGPGWAAASLAVVLLGVVGYFIWRRQLPHFTIESVVKELKFHDYDCHKATLTRRQEAIANHPGITEFWCRNIGADGTLENIQIDGQKPHDEKGMGGDREVCKRFDRPLKPGVKFSTVLTYDLLDSFTGRREGIIHVVEGRTRKLVISVTFPKGKAIREPRALLRYGGEERSELGGLRYAEDRLEIEIRRPKLGAQYCVEWIW